ncbi:MAG: type II secretion system F family protein [Ignavibacteriales bacterium]|nr:type II secretion system F family protein [Ignavibacteriales bacterium]
MAQLLGSEYRLQARDQTGRVVQRFIYATSFLQARKKAKTICQLNKSSLVSLKKKRNYNYSVRRGNKEITGVQSAYSRQEVVSALERLGFKVKFVRLAFEFKMAASTGELVSFIGTSAKLLEQKMPYTEVLRIMSNNVRDNYLKMALRDIIQDLKNGVDSREAFARQGKVLGEHTALMLGIASKSGNMTSIFQSVAQLVERQADFKKGLTSSLILPAVTSLTLVGAIAFYVVYLLPQMAEMLAPMTSTMPPLTRATLEFSSFVQENIGWIITLSLLAITGFYAYIFSPTGKMAFHRFVIRVPYVGRILRNTSVEIFCRVLGIVYTSSGENIDAIRLAGEACGNRYLDKQVKTVAVPLMLKYGTELAHALDQTIFFPEMVISRFRTAGETGDVKATSTQLADYYQMENQYSMKNLVSFIEVAISMIIMVALVFLTYLSSETATIRVDQY